MNDSLIIIRDFPHVSLGKHIRLFRSSTYIGLVLLFLLFREISLQNLCLWRVLSPPSSPVRLEVVYMTYMIFLAYNSDLTYSTSRPSVATAKVEYCICIFKMAVHYRKFLLVIIVSIFSELRQPMINSKFLFKPAC